MPGPFSKERFKPYSPKSADQVFLGMEVKSIITDFRGIVSSVRQLVSGQIQFCVEPKGNGTNLPEPYFMDWQTLEIIGNGIQDRVTKPESTIKVKLGEIVKHKVTGFTGVAVEKFTYINGCVSFWIVPTEDYQKQFKDTLLKPQVVDHHLLETVGAVPDTLVEKAKVAENPPVANKPTGGPSQRATHRLGRM